jgi:nucleotide-binding universal stress UspA family protein
MPHQHLICAIDGSDHSRRAAEFAAAIALGMKCRLTFLTVRPYIVGRSVVADLWSPEEAAKCLDEAVQIARRCGYSDAAAVEFRARDVAHAIVDYAEKNGADHIVMGSAGKDAIKRFVIGSTSADVLRKAFCPVSIVH